MQMIQCVTYILPFVCQMQCSLSSPISRHTIAERCIYSGTGSKVRETSEGVAKSSANLLSATEPDKTALTLVIILYIKALPGLVYVEIFTIASGTHFAFPCAKSEIAEKEHRAVAVTTTKLLTKLHTMQRVNNILHDTTRSMIWQNLKKHDSLLNVNNITEFQQEVLVILFNEIESRFKADPDLYKEFVDLKRNIEPEILPPMGNAIYFLGRNTSMSTTMSTEVRQVLSSHPLGRILLVNMVFVQHATADLPQIKERILFNMSIAAKTLIQLSSQSAVRDTAQAIYYDVLKKVATLTDYVDNCTVQDRVRLHSDILFDELYRRIETEPALNLKFRSIMEQLFTSNLNAYSITEKISQYRRLDNNCIWQVPGITKPSSDTKLTHQ